MITTTKARDASCPGHASGIRPGSCGGEETAVAAGSLGLGAVVEAVFDPNPRASSPFRLRASRAGGHRVVKAILSNDERIRPGVPCTVRITRVRKPSVPGRGYYEATWHDDAPLALPPDVWVPELTRLRMGALLAAGECILLIGPQGCGKTVITAAIAEAMGYEYVYANASAAVEPTDFVARFELTAASGGGVETTWIETELLTAIKAAEHEPFRRRLVFLDELNRSRESARNALMPCLDVTRKIYDPTIGGFRAIPPNVQFVAAVNVGAEFSGTTAIDAAALDRFCPVHLDYPPRAVEAALIKARVGAVRVKTMQAALGIAEAIREESDILGGVSVRATIDAVRMLETPAIRTLGDSAREQIFREAYCGRLDGSWKDAGSDAGRAAQIISRTLAKPGRTTKGRRTPKGAP